MRSRPSSTSRNGCWSSMRQSWSSRSARLHLAHGFLGLPRDVGERADDEVLEVGVAFVEAPPHAPGEVRQFVGRDVVEPFPGQRALAHAADGDDVEEADVGGDLFVGRDPIGEQVQLGLAPDHLRGLEQRVGMGDVRCGAVGMRLGGWKSSLAGSPGLALASAASMRRRDSPND